MEAGKKSFCASDPPAHPEALISRGHRALAAASHCRPHDHSKRSGCRLWAVGCPEPVAWVSDQCALCSLPRGEQASGAACERAGGVGSRRQQHFHQYVSGLLFCQLCTVLISQGPCTGMSYSLPDISPSSAEKFIPALMQDARSECGGMRLIPAAANTSCHSPTLHWGHRMT